MRNTSRERPPALRNRSTGAWEERSSCSTTNNNPLKPSHSSPSTTLTLTTTTSSSSSSSSSSCGKSRRMTPTLSDSDNDNPLVLQRSSSKRRLERIDDSSDTNSANSSRRRDAKRSNKLSSSSSQSEPEPRRVTFEVDQNDNVKTRVRRIRSRNSLCQDDIEQLWWTQEELEDIMEREQNVFEVFSKCCTSYVEAVMRVWEHCKETSSPSSSSSSSNCNRTTLQSKSKLTNNKNMDDTSNQTNTTCSTNSTRRSAVSSNSNHSSSSNSNSNSISKSSRSSSNNSSSSSSTSSDIEKIANAPARGMENDVVISLMPGCRDKAIRCVMETQRTLAKSSAKLRTNTMRRRYRNLSRAASLFAQSIADGDAQVAAALYQ